MIKVGKFFIGSQRELTAEWGQGYDVGSQATRQQLEAVIVSQIKSLKRRALPSEVRETQARINELDFLLSKVKRNG